MTDSISNGGCCSGSVRPGTYGNAYDVAQITVDKCGRITRVTNVPISGGGGGSSQWTGITGNPIYYVPNVGIGSSTTPTAKLQVTGNVYVSNAVTTANVHVTDTLDVLGSMTANAANATFFFDTFTIPYINTQYLNVSSNTTLTGNISMYGDAYVSGSLSAARYYGDGGLLSNISSSGFTQPLPNLVVSNSVTTSNIYVANTFQVANTFFANTTTIDMNFNTLAIPYINTSNIVVSNLIASTGNINMYGNVHVSDTLDVLGSMTANAANATFFFDTFTIPYINTQYLNVSSDTTLTGNLVVSTANIATLNVGYLTVNSAVVYGASTLNVYGTSNLSTAVIVGKQGVTTLNVTGNAYVSNAITTTDIIASGNLYYNEDLKKRAPHLIPTTANASIIQSWISATCNVVDKQGSFWAQGTPTYSNIATGPTGGNLFSGPVSLPDGRILFVPANTSDPVGFFNPFTNQYSTVIPSGDTKAGIFGSGVLIPSGNIVFIPTTSSNIGMFNPTTSVYSNIRKHNVTTPAFRGGVLDGQSNVTMVPSTGNSNIGAYNPVTNIFSNMVSVGTTLGFFGAVLLPTGNIICVPSGASNLVQYNPTTRTYSNSSVGSTGFQGGVLTPTGNVVLIPNTNANVVVVNPNGTPPYVYSNIATLRTGGGGFIGGLLLPSGNVVCVPGNNSNVGMFDPEYLVFSNIAPDTVSAGTVSAFYGGALTPDGRVIFCPNNSRNVYTLTTLTPCTPEFRLSPYFNKF